MLNSLHVHLICLYVITFFGIWLKFPSSFKFLQSSSLEKTLQSAQWLTIKKKKNNSINFSEQMDISKYYQDFVKFNDLENRVYLKFVW